MIESTVNIVALVSVAFGAGGLYRSVRQLEGAVGEMGRKVRHLEEHMGLRLRGIEREMEDRNGQQ